MSALIALTVGALASLGCSSDLEEGTADAGAGDLPPLMGPEPVAASGTPGPAKPTAEEACDAVDNDLDGRVDEVGCACTGETACFAGPPEARHPWLPP
jgi:hypothetical protein